LESITEKTLEVDRVEHVMEVFGDLDKNIQIIEDAFNVKIISRDNEIKVSGSNEGVLKANTVLKRLINLVIEGEIITKQSVGYLVQLADENKIERVNDFCADYVCRLLCFDRFTGWVSYRMDIQHIVWHLAFGRCFRTA